MENGLQMSYIILAILISSPAAFTFFFTFFFFGKSIFSRIPMRIVEGGRGESVGSVK